MVDSDENLDSDRSSDREDSDEFKIKDADNIIPISSTIPKCIIKDNDPRRIKWDVFVMCLATWNCIWIPFSTAFEPTIAKHVIFLVFDNFIDSCFVIDIILTFRTTYIKPSTGDEITDPKKIAKNYLKTRFIIDVLSTFPFRLFMEKNQSLQFLNLFGILKVARVLRLNKIINVLNVKEEMKMTFKLCNLVFSLILYLHLSGCTWYYIIKSNEHWWPPFDYMFGKTDMYERSVLYQYCVSFYIAVLLLNGGDMGPRTLIQYIYVSLSFIVGAMLNANIFGNMAVLLQEINKKAARFREKMDTAKTAMRNMGLPTTIENKVINYLLYTQSNMDKQREFMSMKTMISPSLNMEIVRSIFSKIIIMNPIFGGGNDDLVDTVLQSISTNSFLPEDSIIKQGEDGDILYFLSEGECEAMVTDENSEVHRVDILSPGAMFGEIAIISNCKRTATINCLNYCTCAILTLPQIQEISRKFPEILNKLKARRSQYNDFWKRFLKRLIMSVDYFKRCKPNTIEELIYSLRQEYIEAKKILYKPGDSIENIRFISEGTIEILIQFDDGKEKVIDYLKQGCSFGLYSILEPSPTMFIIRAKTNLTLQYLDFEVLDDLRKNHLDLDRELVEYEKYIDELGLPICDYSIPYKKTLKSKFRQTVRRAAAFNEYKHKKKFKLSKLIVQLKKQKIESDEKDKRKEKREEFKRELANLIYEKIKDIIPNTDESQMYIMEIFKYINKKMEIVTNTLVEQNDYVGYCLGEEDSKTYNDVDDIDNLDLTGMLDDSHAEEESKFGKSEAERINDSFANYLGLSDAHNYTKEKAMKQMKEYKLSKSRRESAQMNNHNGLDQFLGIGRHASIDESSDYQSSHNENHLSHRERQAAIDNVRRQSNQWQ